MKNEIKFGIISIILVIFAICLIYLYFFQGVDCLEEKAEEYCEDNDMIYSGIGMMPTFFFCYEENDKHIQNEFTFTEEEKGLCRLIE